MIHHFKTEEHAWLSNMYYCTVTVDNLVFGSAEHAYMYFKFDDKQWKELCLDKSNSPKLLKAFSREKEMRPILNWNEIRLGIMERIIDAKFSIEPLRSKLIATKNENIQEGNWWNDKFWGVDLKETPNIGENHLGRLIMKTREKLNNAQL